MTKLKKLFLIASYLMLCSSMLYANEPPAQRYEMPEVLKGAEIKDRAAVLKLMESKAFEEQLKELAEIFEVNDPYLTSEVQLAVSSLKGNYAHVIETVQSLDRPLSQFHFQLEAKANMRLATKESDSFAQAMSDELAQTLSTMSDKDLIQAKTAMNWDLGQGQDYLQYIFDYVSKLDTLSKNQVRVILFNYQKYRVYEQTLEVTNQQIDNEHEQRYFIDTDVLIKTPDGATLSAIVVRKRDQKEKLPTALQYTIYSNLNWNTTVAINAAANGYVGVVADTRGKRLSPDEVIPREHDAKDVTAVIDWISKQPWSDGRVGMYGGSYVGFTQWAATKYMHPALKTIVPYAAHNPATGLPMENNIIITPNYQWSFHVTNNKTMDHSVYADWDHWENAYKELYTSGRAFKDIDKIEGTPNPWFQKHIQHPSYDEYYQSFTPYGDDFKKIDIPVLSITGYFDGGAIAAMDYMKRHYAMKPDAEHYLVTGPYDHGTAQGVPGEFYSNYKLDPVAHQKDTVALTFEWFDYIFHGAPKPALLKGKINYQLMGSNTWQHWDSYAELTQAAQTFHLSTKQNEQGYFSLTAGAVDASKFNSLKVDMADRTEERNQASFQVNLEKINDATGLVYVTDAFDEPMELAGEITGNFALSINKRDADIGFNFYEIKENGEIVYFNNYKSRLSYAEDMSKRKLLTPGKKTIVPIINARMTGKLIEKGSRLAIVLDVNKNIYAQVNMGSGKDVSDETVADAGEPLMIKWYEDSEINIPLKPWTPQDISMN